MASATAAYISSRDVVGGGGALRASIGEGRRCMSARGDAAAPARTAADRDRVIASMVSKDRLIAVGFVALLWLSIAYVLLTMGDIIATDGVRIVLIVAGLIQIVLVTAGVMSLIRRADRERERIYGPDLDHSDFNRAARSS